MLVIAGVVLFPLVGMAAGILLYREQRLGLRLAQAFYGVQLALGIAALMAAPSDMVQTLVQLAPAAAWLAYLFRSERVRNTYFDDKAKDTAEVFR